MVVSAAGASAVPSEKVTLCHRTDSETNPYVQITVSANAAYNGHYKKHEGDVWFPGHPKEPKWGDIIPPFLYKGVTYSENWNTAGMAIFNNGCKPVTSGQSSTPPSSPPSSPPTSGSSSVAGSSVASSTPPTSTPASASVSGSSSPAPIPSAVSAGLHTPIANSALEAWGAILMLLGGLGGLLVGIWPTRRRVH